MAQSVGSQDDAVDVAVTSLVKQYECFLGHVDRSMELLLPLANEILSKEIQKFRDRINGRHEQVGNKSPKKKKSVATRKFGSLFSSDNIGFGKQTSSAERQLDSVNKENGDPPSTRIGHSADSPTINPPSPLDLPTADFQPTSDPSSTRLQPTANPPSTCLGPALDCHPPFGAPTTCLQSASTPPESDSFCDNKGPLSPRSKAHLPEKEANIYPCGDLEVYPSAAEVDDIKEIKKARTREVSKRHIGEGHLTRCISNASDMPERNTTPSRRTLLRRSYSAEAQSMQKGFLQRLVLDPRFETTCLILLLLNTICVVAQTEVKTSQSLDHTPTGFIILEVFFCSLFALEVGLRVKADWRFYFGGPGRVLNTWDCFLLGFQITEAIIAWVTSGAPINISYLRILRLARAIRIFRRSMKVLSSCSFLDDSRVCLLAILQSFMPFVGAILVLVVIILCWAVYYSEVALSLSHKSNNGELDRKLDIMFGSLFISIGTLFQCITGGVSWGDPNLGPISLFDNPMDQIVFYFFIAFTHICIMNVITGIVVQQMAVFIEADKLRCVIPHACEVLGSVQKRDPHATLQEAFLNALKEPIVNEVTARGLTGESKIANGGYEQVDIRDGRPVFQQTSRLEDSGLCQKVGESDKPCMMYYESVMSCWCIGDEKAETPIAWKQSTSEIPPKGSWFGGPGHSSAYVQRRKRKEGVELRGILKELGVREDDVENIFWLCDPSGERKVDVNTFVNMAVQCEKPGRRFEQYLMLEELEEHTQNSRFNVGAVSYERNMEDSGDENTFFAVASEAISW